VKSENFLCVYVHAYTDKTFTFHISILGKKLYD